MISGHIDEADRHQIRGWALDKTDPTRRLLLDVFADGRFLGQVLANGFREDLKAAGIGDGFHAFRWRGTGTEAGVRPERVGLRAPRLGRSWLRRREGAVAEARYPNLSAYLRATVGRLPEASGSELRFPSMDGARAFDPLFADTSLDERPVCLGRLPSAYLAHILHRHGAEARFDPGLSESQSLAALSWYLRGYGASRPACRIPLSASDVATLNATGPDGASTFESLFETHYAGEPRHRAVEWGLHNPADLGLDDCIAAPALEPVRPAHLQASPPPCPSGLRLWLDRHPILFRVPTGSSEQVREACVLLMLFAAVAPHLLRLIDPEVMHALLVPHDGISPFERITAHWLGAEAIEPERWRRLVARHGFDLDAFRFSSLTPAGHRIEAARLAIGDGPMVDVQVIGPFSKALGVGASCRRLAESLSRTGYGLRCCDFTLDYTNLAHEASSVPLEPPGPARLTILHLNLEEIPKAFAYLPDVFTGATTIAFSYTELSGLAKEQALGRILVDRIWAASEHVATVLSGLRPVDRVGTCIDQVAALDRTQSRRLAFGDTVPADAFVVLTTCDALSGLQRKNPVASVRAFEAAFPNDANARLVLKTHSAERIVSPSDRDLWASLREIAQRDPRILILDRHMDTAEYRALLAACDVLASLHRAEGFGYNVLEAMGLGVPCLVPDYSGTRDFCNPDTALLVGYRLVPILPGQYPFTRGDQLWAEPDHADAVRALRRAAADPALLRRLGEQGRSLVAERYTVEAFARRLEVALRDLLGTPQRQRAS